MSRLSSSEPYSNSEPLYRPSDPSGTATDRLISKVNERFGLSLKHYSDLYSWSITHLGSFWGVIWDETGVIGERPPHSSVVDDAATPEDNPSWFPDARLNFAENLLRHGSSQKTALIQATEPTPDEPDLSLKRINYAELYDSVHRVALGLRKIGLGPGDRVASYSSNCIENVIACLAATAVGCIWVAAAADFGPDGVFERLEQVHPSVLFVVDSTVYNGRVHDHIPKVKSLLEKLDQKCGIRPHTIVIHTIPQPRTTEDWKSDWTSWSAFQVEPFSSTIDFARLPFDHPLWILFSSGTTGKPKPIVHRSGGMLLQSAKELAICGDVTEKDVFFYYTTTGWMMHNFLLGGLNVGASLVLYDGSPLKDPSLLWRLTDECGISIFGTSAKYLDHLSKAYKPREHHKLTALRQIYSTGSPLSPPLFDYVYRDIKSNVLLGSITGGTDICSLFAGMNTSLPVFRGELQCRMLGMAIESYGPSGEIQNPDDSGELVCLRPFPCEPLGFWPLPGFGSSEAVTAAQERFRKAYFAEYPGIWYHGDHIVITPSRENNGGGVVMLGRSDGVLNPGGVRFGTAEIYEVLDACFSSESSDQHIVDYVAVAHNIADGTDEEVVLFVKLPNGKNMSEELRAQIKSEIRKARSPRHVPAKIIQVDDIPYTLNGKKVEVVLKKIINGAPLESINVSTLANAECLNFYLDLRKSL